MNKPGAFKLFSLSYVSFLIPVALLLYNILNSKQHFIGSKLHVCEYIANTLHEYVNRSLYRHVIGPCIGMCIGPLKIQSVWLNDITYVLCNIAILYM